MPRRYGATTATASSGAGVGEVIGAGVGVLQPVVPLVFLPPVDEIRTRTNYNRVSRLLL
jgi:hypothetical protein